MQVINPRRNRLNNSTYLKYSFSVEKLNRTTRGQRVAALMRKLRLEWKKKEIEPVKSITLWGTKKFNIKQEAESHCDFFRQGGTEMIDLTYNIWFWKRNASLREKKLSMEILMEEFKPM